MPIPFSTTSGTLPTPVLGYSDSDFDNNIDTSNTVDGKPIYYLRNIENRVYDSETNAGTFYLIECNNVIIKNLTLTRVGFGVFFWKTNNSVIENVDVSGTEWTTVGIMLSYSNNNTVMGSTLWNGSNGIALYRSQSNTITSNTIRNHEFSGLHVTESNNNNTIYFNNILNNGYNTTDSLSTWNSLNQITYNYNYNSFTNYLGNYWSDYTGSDSNGDGIGDTPYIIEASKQDYYPLMQPFENYTTDTTPPAAVTDLSVNSVTSNSVTLNWIAPGDDENTGTATTYDIRYSTLPITEANWSSTTQCVGAPSPQTAGSSETFTVSSLSSGTLYYFAIKTADEVSNWSGISNVVSGTTTLIQSEQPQLKAPWSGTATITQGNNGATSHHDYGTWDNTYAIDVALTIGSDILAPANGTVVYSDNDAGGAGGKEIAIEHIGTTGKKFVTVYLHLSEILVGVGDPVVQGQVIAKSGDTGNVTGPHLHFHLWNGTGSYDSHTMPIERLVMKQSGVDTDFREYDARIGELDNDKIADKLFESNNVPMVGTISGEVFVTTPYAEEYPLSGVKVLLTKQTQEDPYWEVANTTADDRGHFSFTSSFSSDYYNVLVLLEDGSHSGSAVLSVYHNNIMVNVVSPAINYTAGSTQNIWIDFNYLNPNLKVLDMTTTPYSDLSPASLPLDRLDDLAAIYYHMKQAVDFTEDTLGFPPGLTLPLKVHAYSSQTNSAMYDNIVEGVGTQQIYISEAYSAYTNPSRPMFEWHEFFHYMMDTANLHPTYSKGYNTHGGFSNPSTMGSWIEGWAEFWPCVLKQSLGKSKPYEYLWNHEDMSVIRTNIEDNLQPWSPLLGGRWNKILWEGKLEPEEFAVAGLLWDLIDPINNKEDDFINIPLNELWNILKAGTIDGVHDLYVRLRGGNIGLSDTDRDKKIDLDELFIAHGFFADKNGNHNWNKGEEAGWGGMVGRL